MPEGRWDREGVYANTNSQDIRNCRPLRGRVIVQLMDEPMGSIITLDKPSSRKIHRGRVVSFGAPAVTKGGVEVPVAFAVGDVVLFVYALSLEKSRRFADGLTFVAQEEIVAVLDLEPGDVS